MPTDTDYTISDLARATGINVRTIRYWIAQGLIPASGEPGPGAHYGQGHLDRLRLIKRLQAEYLPNAEIRRRLEQLSDLEVASLVGEAPDNEGSVPATSALEYVRGLLGSAGGQQMAAASAAPAAAQAAPAGPVPQAAGARLAPARHPAASPDPAVASPHPALETTRPMPVDASERVVEDLPRYAATGIRSGALTAEPKAADTPSADAGATTEPSTALERSQWERMTLGPNIELHIRRPLSRPEQRRVERLITIARQVLDERNAP